MPGPARRAGATSTSSCPGRTARAAGRALVEQVIAPALRALGRGGRRTRERGARGASGPTSPSACAARPGTPSACSSATSCCTRPGWSTSRWRDAGEAPAAPRRSAGAPMALDHRRILATAARPPARQAPATARWSSSCCRPTFTLLQLQRVVEALAGVRLHKQNFRRLVEQRRPGRGHRRRSRPARAAGPRSCSASAARCCASGGRRASACRARRSGSLTPGRLDFYAPSVAYWRCMGQRGCPVL